MLDAAWGFVNFLSFAKNINSEEFGFVAMSLKKLNYFVSMLLLLLLLLLFMKLLVLLILLLDVFMNGNKFAVVVLFYGISSGIY